MEEGKRAFAGRVSAAVGPVVMALLDDTATPAPHVEETEAADVADRLDALLDELQRDQAVLPASHLLWAATVIQRVAELTTGPPQRRLDKVSDTFSMMVAEHYNRNRLDREANADGRLAEAILAELAQRGRPLSWLDLVRLLHQDRGAVFRALRKLEDEGQVRKRRAGDRADGAWLYGLAT